MRSLTKTLAVMTLLAPASAYSLGIGSIRVHSGLNQNLNAEISLVTSADEDVSDIKVSLAPPPKFDEAGIPWSSFLSKIKFETVSKPNGSTVIKVTSNEALKESFLDFLLEVNWPKGSLYREFTVLVDPPSYQKVSTTQAPVYRHYEAPKTYNEPPPKRHVDRPRQVHHIVHTGDEGGGSNVTRKNDTLWKVAERVKPNGDVSVEQMMIALYEANPQAFFKDNVNALLPNKKLSVPSKSKIEQLTRSQALAEFNKQMRAWKNNAAVAATPQKEETPVEEPETVDKQLTLVAPTETPVSDDAASTLSHGTTPATEKPADNKVEPAEEKPKAGDANGQEGTAKSGANVIAPGEDEKGKMAALETQVSNIQKNLSEKEQQIQNLQNAGKPTAVPQENPPTAKEAEEAGNVIKAPQLPKLPDIKPVVPIQQTLVESPSVDTTYLWVGGIGGGLLSLIGWLWWRKRKFDEQFDGESMFAPSSMIKAATSTFRPLSKESRLAPPSMIPSGPTAPLEDNSFLNEFTASDFEVFDTSHVEIDPISETDVYLAYGRYQQAEELMRQAIKEQPDNDEYKLKLLEIFCANERKKDFMKYATELADAGKKNQPEFWVKVVEMGGEVWADLPLTDGGDMFISDNDPAIENIYTNLATVEQEEPALDLLDNPSELSNADVSTFDSEFEESLMGSDFENFDPDQHNAYDFDLKSDVGADNDLIDDDMKNNASIDFDLDSLGIRSQNGAATEETVKPSINNSLSLDKNSLDLGDIQEIEIADLVVAPENEGLKAVEKDDFNFEVSDKTANSHDHLLLEPNSPTTLALSESNQSIDDASDDFDFDFDFNLPTNVGSESKINYFDESDNSFDFMELDELETKLDLAKAYIDMGDSDAAKEIIAEVLDKGNPEQIKTARNLFDSLV